MSLHPWKRGKGMFENDGPDQQVTYILHGHEIRVTPTQEEGVHSGRRRYGVSCQSCSTEIHPATTGPAQMANSHTKGW